VQNARLSEKLPGVDRTVVERVVLGLVVPRGERRKCALPIRVIW